MINFDSAFGKNNTRGNVASNGAADDRPKAELWLNVGYTVQVQGTDEEGKAVTEDRFVSLPTGIPVDTMEKVSTRSSNKGYAAFQSARNDLLDQIIAKAESLAPGEDAMLNLQLQIRRVNGEQAEISSEENPFVQKLEL